MANNFTKNMATFFKDGVIPSTGGKYQLSDKQLGLMGPIIKGASYATRYKLGVTVQGIATAANGAGSVTISWDSEGGDFAPQTTIGQGTINAGTGFNQKTFYMSKALEKKEAFAAYDLQRGLQEATKVKFAYAIAQAAFAADVKFFETMATSIEAADVTEKNVIKKPANNTSYTIDEKLAIKKQLVDAAIELSRKSMPQHGIMNGFSLGDIFIDIDPILFNELVDEKIIQDKSKEVFEGGYFVVGQIGGYTIRAVEHLRENNVVKAAQLTGNTAVQDATKDHSMLAVVSTVYAAYSATDYISAIAGKLDQLSTDQGYLVRVAYTGDSQGNPTYFDRIIPGAYLPFIKETGA